jgi:hypothetical protein
MLSNRIAHLVPPPRRVPLPVVCSAMLGMTGIIGAAFLILGMLFVWLFVGDPAAPLWVCFVLIFPAVGAAFFATNTVRGAQQVALLRHGRVAGARRVSEQATNTTVNDQPVVKYVYEFQAGDGRTYRGASRAISGEEIGDEDVEPVLYLPSNPNLSVLVDTLPLRSTLDVDQDGQWVSYESVWPVVWLGLAWMGVLAHAMYGLSRLLGAF